MISKDERQDSSSDKLLILHTKTLDTYKNTKFKKGFDIRVY